MSFEDHDSDDGVWIASLETGDPFCEYNIRKLVNVREVEGRAEERERRGNMTTRISDLGFHHKNENCGIT